MKDEIFINEILEKGKVAKEKVNAAFALLTSVQLNHKPSEKSWSIAQCLEHLIISHSAYFAELQKINEGSFKMSFWERYSPLTKTFGKIMTGIQEKVKKKMKAPGKIKPSTSEISIDIIDRYQKSMDTFLQHVSKCNHVDLDKTIITSPIAAFVTYSLRDAFRFLLQHEHRHINQAIRVRASEGFPKE